MLLCFHNKFNMIMISITCVLWILVTLVECNNVSTEWKFEPILGNKMNTEKTKKLTKFHTNNTRLPNPAIVTGPGKNKGNIIKGKVQLTKGNSFKNLTKKDKSMKFTKGQRGRLQDKFYQNKKLNVRNSSDSKGQPTKGSLRKGKLDKNEKWPKIQKRRLRADQYQNSSKRITKMNMMQMEETTKAPKYKISNEALSPYLMKDQLTRIMAKFTDANVTMEVIGRTLEYNDIILLKIAQVDQAARFRADDQKYVDDSAEKKILFIVHGLSVMGMYELNCLSEEVNFIELVSYYLKYLDKFDIFLVPMANPDGYGYVKKVSYWNKNMSPQNACPGVAVDRNFDVAWDTSRTVNSCSQQYPGVAPFSEPESRAIRDVLHRYAQKIIAYIHVHGGTYNHEVFKGDAVLYPKGYTDVQTDDDKYIDLKGEIEDAMKKANFQSYSVKVESLHSWYGRISGSSVDYASTVYGIPYAMEFVMQVFARDKDTDTPSAEETEHHALVEVWRRVIEVVVNNIWNSFHSNEL